MLIADTMIPAMDAVGKLFEEEEYFVPELLLAGRAMKAAMEPLRPLLAAAGAKPVGVILVGTVKGDLHDIGKNLVVSMLEGEDSRSTTLARTSRRRSSSPPSASTSRKSSASPRCSPLLCRR